MLKNAKIMAFTGTRDAARAKSFYRDQLGLTLVEENSRWCSMPRGPCCA
jgi:predicted enzyme related to lactoylglutathione lyase